MRACHSLGLWGLFFCHFRWKYSVCVFVLKEKTSPRLYNEPTRINGDQWLAMLSPLGGHWKRRLASEQWGEAIPSAGAALARGVPSHRGWGVRRRRGWQRDRNCPRHGKQRAPSRVCWGVQRQGWRRTPRDVAGGPEMGWNGGAGPRGRCSGLSTPSGPWHHRSAQALSYPRVHRISSTIHGKRRCHRGRIILYYARNCKVKYFVFK